MTANHRVRIGTDPDGDNQRDPPQGPESITRNTLFALAVQLSGAAFTAALTLILVRALSTEGYGIFALALGVGGLATIPSDLGVSSSASRFIAEHRGDEGAIGVVLARAFRLKLVLAAAVSVALFAAAGPISSAYDEPDLLWPLRAIGIAVFGQSLMLLFSGAFIAQGLTSRNFRLVLSESAIEFGATVALVLLGTGATGAAFGRATGYSFGALLGIVMTLRLLRRARRARRSAQVPETGQIVRYAGSLAVVDWVYTSLHYMDAIILGALLNPAAVGLFQAPFRLIALLNHPGAAVAAGVAPRLARGRREEPNVAAFTAGLRLLLLVQAALVALLLVWADPIVGLLFGSDFEDSGDVLRALAPYVFLSGLAQLVSLGANYLGMARRRIPIAVAALVVNLVLDFLLIPSIGVVGASIATSAGFAVYVPGHLWLCKSVMEMSLRPLAATLARVTLAAAVLAGILFSFGTSTLSAFEWLAGGALGTAAYVGVLLLTRELTRSDLSLAAAAVNRRLGRA